MATHATMPVQRQHHGSLSWALPLSLGVFYGFYAGFLRREGQPVTWWDVLFGAVVGLIFAGLAYTLGRFQQSLPRELRAGAYGVLTGVAMGFLNSQTGESVLHSSVIGLVIGAVMLAVSFYIFYMRES
ncbi:hypothetical protein [Streptomyces sp. NPDC020681]|uniref:hypothetical protein n=1 Tax=Streptomyces sp. NPDC020681 TaxID=3365083 RepID=UPI0037A58D6B